MRKLEWGLMVGLLALALGLGLWHTVTRTPSRPATQEAIVDLVWETFEDQEGVYAVETEVSSGDHGAVITTVHIEVEDRSASTPDFIDGGEVAELLEQVGTTLAPRLKEMDLDGLEVAVKWERESAIFVATYPLSDLIEPEFFAFYSPQRQQLRAASWYPDWNISVQIDRDGFLVTHAGTGRHRETLGEVVGSSEGFNRETWTQAGWQITMAVNEANRYFLPELLSIADSLPEAPEGAAVAMSYAPLHPQAGIDDSGWNPHELLFTGLSEAEMSDADVANLVGTIDTLCSANKRKDQLDQVWLSWTTEARTDSSLRYSCGDSGLVVPDATRGDFDAERSTAILEQGRQS